MLEELHRRHAYAMLIREGERPKDSRHPGVLQCEMLVYGLPERARPGDRASGAAVVTNVGDTLWLSTPTAIGGFVTLAYKLLSEDGRVVPIELPRSFLAADVAPGGSVTLPLEIVLPSELASGRYRLQFDMVDELVCWFSDLTGTPGAVHEIRID